MCRPIVWSSATSRAQATAEEKNSGQIGLFRGNGGPEPLRLPNIPEWEALDRLGYEAEAIGFHLTGHPMDACRAMAPGRRRTRRDRRGNAAEWVFRAAPAQPA